MKYLKKYNILKEESTILNNLSDEDLEEKSKHLRIELKDIEEELASIYSILRKRESDKDENFSKDFPKSIFDLNTEQLEFIFQHNHSTSQARYGISGKYFSQLRGVNNSGFNKNTNQFYFNISVGSCFNLFNTSQNFGKLEPGVMDSIKFLGNNLKSNNGYVEFGIQYDENDEYDDKLLYIDENDLIYKNRGSKKKFDSIESIFKDIYTNDTGV